MQKRGIRSCGVTELGRDIRDIGVQLPSGFFIGRDVHGPIECVLYGGAVVGGEVPGVKLEVGADAGVGDHGVEVVGAVVVGSGTDGFEGLFAVCPDLVLPGCGEVGLDGVACAVEVAHEDLEGGELVEEERAVVAARKLVN